MNKKSFALMAALLLLSLVISGCTRSATSKSPTDASPTSEIPFPIASVDTSARMTEIYQQTQQVISTPVVAPTLAVPQVGATATNVAVTATLAVPTATRAPVTIPTLTRPSSYTLQSGEWPICIARRYNLDLESFLAANNLSMNSSPPAGTVLVIPESGTWAAGERTLKEHPADYTVAAGDSIYSVACAYGDVDPMAIVAANNLQEPYTLTPGSVIYIP